MDQKKTNKVIIFFEYVYQIILISLNFLIFTLLGLVIFGIGPALRASVNLLIDYKTNKKFNSFKQFYSYYKINFLNYALYFCVYFVLIAVPILNRIFVSSYITDELLLGVFLSFNLVFFIFGITGAFSVYFFERYLKINIKQATKYSFTIIWGRLSVVFSNIVLLVVNGVIIYFVPYIAVVYAVGLHLFLLDKVFISAYKKLIIKEEIVDEGPNYGL